MSGRILKLTPELFRKLDVIARVEAGSSICVLAHNDKRMHRKFAYMDFWGESLVVDLSITELLPDGTIRGKCKGTAIYLANQIDVEAFYGSTRPEMDWSRVPEDHIYHFMLQHEIGHKRTSPNMWEISKRFEWYLVNVFVECQHTMAVGTMEMIADRYAWARLFPKCKIPKRKGCSSLVRRLERLIEINRDLFHPDPKSFEPLPTDPGLYVPCHTVKYGIPWAA